MIGQFAHQGSRPRVLPDDGELSAAPRQPRLVHAQPNRLFQKREDKDALKRYRAERKKKAKLKKESVGAKADRQDA